MDTRLQNGFAPGMKLEVVVKTDPETYWVATVITTCEQLLLLRYDGYGEDRRADFWCDIRKAGLYPIGWCEQNKKTLEAPEGNKILLIQTWYDIARKIWAVHNLKVFSLPSTCVFLTSGLAFWMKIFIKNKL